MLSPLSSCPDLSTGGIGSIQRPDPSGYVYCPGTVLMASEAHFSSIRPLGAPPTPIAPTTTLFTRIGAPPASSRKPGTSARVGSWRDSSPSHW